MSSSLSLATSFDVAPPPISPTTPWEPYALGGIVLVVFIALKAMRKPRVRAGGAFDFDEVGGTDAVSVLIKPTLAEGTYGALAWYVRKPLSWMTVGLAVTVVLMNVSAGQALDARTALAAFGCMLFMPILLVIGMMTNAQLRELRASGMRLSFYDTHIDVKRPQDAAQLAWDVFKKGWETRGAFVLRMERGVLVVPKRCFAATTDVDHVRALLKRNAAL